MEKPYSERNLEGAKLMYDWYQVLVSLDAIYCRVVVHAARTSVLYPVLIDSRSTVE